MQKFRLPILFAALLLCGSAHAGKEVHLFILSGHWDMVREAQVKVAEDDPRVAWIDTDDLNGKKDGLHYDKAGYAELGKRFAEAALKLIGGQ
jgi:hypothetical protein